MLPVAVIKKAGYETGLKFFELLIVGRYLADTVFILPTDFQRLPSRR